MYRYSRTITVDTYYESIITVATSFLVSFSPLEELFHRMSIVESGSFAPPRSTPAPAPGSSHHVADTEDGRVPDDVMSMIASKVAEVPTLANLSLADKSTCEAMTPVLATIKNASIEMLGAYERDPTWTPGEDSRGFATQARRIVAACSAVEKSWVALAPDENGAKVRARQSPNLGTCEYGHRIETSPFDGGGVSIGANGKCDRCGSRRRLRSVLVAGAQFTRDYEYGVQFEGCQTCGLLGWSHWDDK